MMNCKSKAWLGTAAFTGALGLTLGLGGSAANAQSVIYEATNYTNSAGDTTNDVTDDVLFTNLMLKETFADGLTRTDTLFDTSHTPQTSVDAVNGTNNDNYLDSNSLILKDALNSPVVSAVLTGQIAPPAADNNGNGTYTLNTQTDPFDFSTVGTATVGPNFFARLTQFTPNSSSVEIYAENTDGTPSANGIGSLAVLPGSAAPEPSQVLGLAAFAGILSLVIIKRRKNADAH